MSSIFAKQKFQSTLFVILRYIEILIIAYITFAFARKVTPFEYGKASKYFITITYSAFAALGINQVLLKWHSTTKSSEYKIYLETYSFFYNSIVAVFVFIILFNFLEGDKSLLFFISMICSLKILQECFNNIYRVKKRWLLININSLVFSIIFLTTFHFYVFDTHTYFKFWMSSLLVSVSISMIYFIIKRDYSNLKSGFLDYLRNNIFNLLKDGVKLALIVFVTPWLTSIDRIVIINFTSISNNILGSLQLADNISSAVTMGFSAIIYIYSPNIISKIHNNEIEISVIYKYATIIVSIMLMCLLIFYYPLKMVINYFYNSYVYLLTPLIFMFISKIFLLLLTVPNLICISLSKEIMYLKITIISLISLTLIYIFISKYLIGHQYSYIYFSAALTFVTIIMNIFFRNQLLKIKIN